MTDSTQCNSTKALVIENFWSLRERAIEHVIRLY